MQNVRVTFGDGTPPVDLGGVTGSGITAGHIYAAAGTYLATAIATDSAGGTATASSQVVVVAPTAPSVSVVVTGSSVANAPTTFTINAAPAAGSGSTIQNVRVTFGDGSAPVDLGAVNAATTTQHVYAASGSYTVTATATDSAGVTATSSVQVVVAAPGAPSVAISASANPVAGSPVTFTITAAPAPGSNTTIQKVVVDFGDKTPPVDLGAVSSPASAQHVFAAAGNYTVSATATASNGATATASTQVVVAASPANVPSVSVTASANPVAGSAVTFTITAAPAPGSNTTIQKVVVDFGDKTPPVDLGAVTSPATAQHVFAAAGTYTVTATATASNSATATASTQVVVAAPGAPSVSVTASANPIAGTSVTFTVTAAPAAGSNTTITNVQVNFGDNTPVVNLGAVSSPTTAQHVFAAAGNYTVTATATASNNATASASTQVVVAAPGAPNVSVTASANPVAGRAVTFTVTATPAPGTNTTITNVQVNFGDNTPVVNLGAVSSPVTTQHAYAAAGTYTVSATATASNSLIATVSIQVVVAPPPSPSVSIAASANPVTGRATTFTITAALAPGSTSPPNVVVNFGDSAQSNLGAVNGTVTTQHVYSVPGTYTVSATATDVGGGTAIARTDVTVLAPATVSLGVSANPMINTPVQFTVSVAPVAGVTVQNVRLQYGDNTQEDLGPVGSTPVVRSHTYNTFGTKTATATATFVGFNFPVTASATVAVAPCSPLSASRTIAPVFVGGFFDFAWPGGDTVHGTAACSVTVRAPTGDVMLAGDTWSIVGLFGYSAGVCTLTPQVPLCTDGRLESNGRPICPVLLFPGPASVNIRCN
jgi:PKD repeat protein